jgi:hypothetical protein
MSLMERLSKVIERNKNILKNLFTSDPQPTKTTGYADDAQLANADVSNWKVFLDDAMQRNASDKSKYSDYDLMDSEIPEVSAALDVMADFVVYPDNVNKTKIFKVMSKKKNINKYIDEIDIATNFHSELHSMAREACKYGDDYEELLFEKKSDIIVGFRNAPVSSMMVNMINGVMDKSISFRQVGANQDILAELAYDEMMHLSLNTDRNRYAKYGKGVSRIEKSRLIYRQLRLMEEGVMINRLSRSNQSYGIMVDVGDLVGDEALDFIDKYKRRITRKKYVDPLTGRMSFKYNPLSIIEDIYVPIRAGSGAGIQSLNNSEGSKNIDDINYFQNKLIYSTGVPKLLIGKEEDINSKSTTETQYVCFLRTIRRIQTLLEPEILRFYKMALLSRGIDAPDLYIYWPVTNTIDEERRMRIEQVKTNIGISLCDKSLIDDYFMYKNFMGMSDEEIVELTTRMDETEAKISAEVDAAITNPPEDEGTIDATQADEEPDTTSTSTPGTPTKKSNPDSSKETTEALVMEQFKKNLDKESYFGFEKIAGFLKSNPEVKKLVGEYISLTNAQLGE